MKSGISQRTELTTERPSRLEISDLVVKFRKGRRELLALDRVSLRVSDGEFVCLVGASGCGKTTLLRAIAGLMPPTAGEVLVDGRKANPASGAMAMVFQRDALFPWRTVVENVRFGLDVRRRRGPNVDRVVKDCINLVGLDGFEGHYPHELSGGMRQRANLARALAVDPEVLLMDEPFAALDAQTREVMQSELLDLWTKAKKTVVFVTHQLDEAVYLGDRVVVMATHPGRIRQQIPIDLPRPRTLDLKRTPQFGSYVDQMWHLIEGDVRRSMVERKRAEARA